MTFACSQLIHSYPRVRRYAAEQIYVCLLEHPEHIKVPDNEFILGSLLDFPWDDSDRKATHCREMAQKIADAVRVPLLVENLQTYSPDKALNRPPRDEFATYAALVDSVIKTD